MVFVVKEGKVDSKDNYDIPSLREKLLACLGEKADAYPRQIEQRFPHILAKLVSLWGKPEADAYLNGLMVADRADRQGFPADAASELFRLSMIHGALQPEKPTFQAGWASGDVDSEVDDFFSRRSSR
jgi:hypothetical protein